MMLDIFTSFATFEAGAEPHVEEALKRNIANDLVRRIYVLTETTQEEILAAYPQLKDDKICLLLKPMRPSFGAIIEEINRSFAGRGTKIAALLNADISFCSRVDITRTCAVMEGLPGKRNALALTRYDRLKNDYAITLQTEMGLPNLISADVWVFDQPVSVVNDMYYLQGQMNCDKFFTYDLSASGYAVFNPCLDIRALHHEAVIKDNNFYRAANSEEEALEQLREHWRRSVTKGEGYSGIVRVKSTDLLAGYLPAPLKWARSNKFYLCIPKCIELSGIESILVEAKRLSEEYSFDVCLLYERESMREDLTDWLISAGGSRFAPLKVESLDFVMDKLLSGRSEGLDEALLVNAPEIWNSGVLEYAPAVFVMCRNGQRFPEPKVEDKPTVLNIDHKFRINGLTENLYKYITRLFMGDEATVVLWHKNDEVNQELVTWLNRVYRRTF